jgi:hypothetical protein
MSVSVPKGQKINQHFPKFPKFTQIGIFGLKINHLVTLVTILGELFANWVIVFWGQFLEKYIQK